METLNELWHRLLATFTGSNPAPDAGWQATIVLIAAAGLVFVPRIWRFSGLCVTVVHELGHGLTGLLRGRRSVAIRVNTDHSGLTSSRGTATSAGFSTFWGYPAPAVYGVLLLVATCTRHAGLALVASAGLLLVCLIFMRGWLTWLLCLAVVLLATALAVLIPSEWLGHVVGGIGLFFLLGSLRAFGNLLRAHARGDRSGSDAAILARATGAPAGLWLTLMALVILICAAAAAWMIWSVIVA